MRILELHTLTDSQLEDLIGLMGELDPEITVTAEGIRRAVEMQGTHFFAAIDDDGHIVGCATLCVLESPTGRKASVEDVVVGSAFRGQGLGRSLMERIIDFARTELDGTEIHLTSRPQRIAANSLYLSLGFEKRETNIYRLKGR